MSFESEDSAANVIHTIPPIMNSSDYWQLTKEKMAQRGEHILQTEQWTDCKFIVGKEILEAHKLILAMSSPVFEAMFFGEMAEKNDSIQISDAEPEVFKALLQYIYTDTVKIGSFELAYELCYCAKKYMFPFLVDECMKFILSNLSPRNACRIYEFTKLFEKPFLMEKCLQMIRSKTSVILSEPSFEEIELETLVTIFEQTELQIYSEIELFSAAERWARFKCMKNGLDPDDGESLRTVIGNALTQIRFPTLTPQEFTQGPADSPLLRRSEAFDIIKNISCKDQNWSMPEGFSTNVQSRAKRLKREIMTNLFSTVVLMADTSGTNGTTASSQDENEYLAQEDFPMKYDLLNTMLTSKSGKARKSLEHYCHRFTLERINSESTNALKCSEIFKVDKNICLMGIQVPSQIGNDTSSYTEMLTVKVTNSNRSINTERNFTPEVNKGTLIKLLFENPVYIDSTEQYRIEVAFGKIGCYPLLPCRHRTFCNGVFFTFGFDNRYDDTNNQNSLIASIIFMPIVQVESPMSLGSVFGRMN